MELRYLNAFVSSLGFSVEILPILRTPHEKVRFHDDFKPENGATRDLLSRKTNMM